MSVTMYCSGGSKVVGLSEYKKPMLIASGHFIEYCDFFLYGLLSPFFIKSFIPEDHETLAIFYAYALFFIGFFVRPVGIFIWGHVADRYGRKPVLLLTITLMAIPALGIALLPTYNYIGFFAPTVLIVLRIIQGLAYSGEMPTAIASLYELAPKNKKIVYCSFLEIGGTSAVVTVSTITALLTLTTTSDQFSSWGWRVPFVISFLAIFILRHIRASSLETIRVKSTELNHPALYVIQKKYLDVIKICVLIAPISMIFQSYATFIPNRLIELVGMSHSQTFLLTACLFFYIAVLIPITAQIVKNFDIKALMLIGFIGISIANFFACFLIDFQNILFLILSLIFIGLFLALLLATYISFIAGQSKKNYRVSQTGFAITLSFAIFGGATPFINTFLSDFFNSTTASSFYLIAVSIVASFILYNLKSTRNIGHD